MKGRNMLLLGMKGSFENLTVTKARDGDAIVKGKINDPQIVHTEEIAKNRLAFLATVSIGRTLLLALNTFFFPRKALHSAYNAFVSQLGDIVAITQGTNIDSIVALDPLGPWMYNPEYSRNAGFFDNVLQEFKFADGRLYPLTLDVNPASDFAVVAGVGTVNIEWAYDAGSLAQDGTNTISLIRYNPTTEDFNYQTTADVRSDGAISIAVDVPTEGAVYYAVFATNAGGVRTAADVSSAKMAFSVDSAGTLSTAQGAWA